MRVVSRVVTASAKIGKEVQVGGLSLHSDSRLVVAKGLGAHSTQRVLKALDLGGFGGGSIIT